MVKIGPRSPALNTLDVQEHHTYAFTARGTWQVINFFLEELKPVNVGDNDIEDRKCIICTREFTDDHRAVKLPCNHVFGTECIEKWLRPFPSPALAQLETQPSLGANTCPECRRVFFPQQTYSDKPNSMESRVRFWDLAYAHVGIALSESERRTRSDLLRYLSFGRGLDRSFPSDAVRAQYIGWVHQGLHSFCHHLRSERLTPVQEHLRQGLEEIAVRGFQTRNDPDGVRFWRDDHGELFFEARHGWDPAQSGKLHEGDERNEREEQVEGEEESDALIEGDTEEMRCFRALFR